MISDHGDLVSPAQNPVAPDHAVSVNVAFIGQVQLAVVMNALVRIICVFFGSFLLNSFTAGYGTPLGSYGLTSSSECVPCDRGYWRKLVYF